MFTLAKIIKTKPKPPTIEIDETYHWINPLTLTAQEAGSSVSLSYSKR
jgi:hypothetical protein